METLQYVNTTLVWWGCYSIKACMCIYHFVGLKMISNIKMNMNLQVQARAKWPEVVWHLVVIVHGDSEPEHTYWEKPRRVCTALSFGFTAGSEGDKHVAWIQLGNIKQRYLCNSWLPHPSEMWLLLWSKPGAGDPPLQSHMRLFNPSSVALCQKAWDHLLVTLFTI